MRHQASLPPLLCQAQPRACKMCCFCFCCCCCCCCCCRCAPAALVLLLCMCVYCPVLLMMLLLPLLCLEYVSGANPRAYGKFPSEPLSVTCLRIRAEYGPICFGSSTSTVSQMACLLCPGRGLVPAFLFFFVIRTCTLFFCWHLLL